MASDLNIPTASDGIFDPNNVDLDTADPRDIICYLNAGGNDYDGRLGLRLSALFVILVTSSLTTLFPVLATRVRWFRVPLYVYLFARYFGAGVIIATAFIHLLDPAYDEIGPATCVGMTGGWAEYSWPPAIAMTSVMLIFLLDFGAEWYVEQKFGFQHEHIDIQGTVTGDNSPEHPGPRGRHQSHQFLHSADQGDTIQPKCDNTAPDTTPQPNKDDDNNLKSDTDFAVTSFDAYTGTTAQTERAFREQIAAFMILEFGVIFHSVIIGLNLGVVGEEFSTLYPVVVFHQAFEGLGIGARLSVIPFPHRLGWMPWMFCAAYGLTTPIAIAVGLGLATQYDPGSFTASVVSGVLDSVSAGILLYTGLVELLARDFLFNPERTRDKRRILFMLVCLLLGTVIMALLGKWA
ncbi:Zinc/iron permease [Podospora appendiculata]|uniref:Zinc/iron permease n=1 Tax=Podospora appendiculata TaxID=314037 RepID=A0AAE0XAQ7_9PEZI|nr:Zinc/iron permease [Podospora appendiculata]